ncbi:hypothetical protein AMATHDRAFT_67687 [Amanita thiersii Skay4041]|uniref:Uncharacterized protein n=1 Tax=Amanita thiersii Skay4041 TaxID=703135 RepID=A0A2A9N997_9AGAR|nr:hypothetical protein AMATHDRAFT_67687 [Amanita thiersii Skay4041]
MPLPNGHYIIINVQFSNALSLADAKEGARVVAATPELTSRFQRVSFVPSSFPFF